MSLSTAPALDSADLFTYARNVRARLCRKFEAADVVQDARLMQAARAYAASYAGDFRWMLGVAATVTRTGWLTATDAKGALNTLMTDRAPAPARSQSTGAPAVTQPGVTLDDLGVYVLPDRSIIKIQPSRSSSHPYAKRWVHISGERLTAAIDPDARRNVRSQGQYEYAPGMASVAVRIGRRMTLEEAKRFTVLYGRCCRCSRTLKAAQSVEAGIGPVCVQWFGGYGALAAPAPIVQDAPPAALREASCPRCVDGLYCPTHEAYAALAAYDAAFDTYHADAQAAEYAAA